MLGYVVELEKNDAGQVIALSPLFSEITAQGVDEDNATESLRLAIEKRFFSALKEKKPIPLPSKVSKNRTVITFPVLVVSKIYLVNSMIEKRIQKTELAKRLDCHMQQVDRLLDFSHASKIERIEEALKVLGRGLELRPSDHILDSFSVGMLKKEKNAI